MSDPASIPTIGEELHSAFQSYMTSAIFELVAKNDVTFFVHKDILSHHSQPFKDATNGPWTESNERKILLPDWDGKTVGRLVQFMYTGNYKYPDPGPCDEPLTPVEKEEADTTPPAEPRRSGRLTPFPECVNGALHQHGSPSMTDASWLESVNTANFDFEETFLAHATVYTLAQYKSIAALKALAHGRLSRTLLKLHPLGCNPHLAKNIISLATYVYANTDSLTNSEEPLRRTVSQHVAWNFSRWQSEPAAVEMMCTGGDFVRDVLQKVCRRLRGGVVGRELAPPGTRYIVRFAVITQRNRPKAYIREMDHLTGKEKFHNQMILLIPEYTTDPAKAATHFYVSQEGGLNISLITGKSCASPCYFNPGTSGDSQARIIEMVYTRSSGRFLDMTNFPAFDGITSHTAHMEGHESIHILWKSIRIAPA